MKRILFLCILSLGMNCFAQTKEKVKPVYNAALAKKLGADEYGMKNYVMAFLLRGDADLDSVQREHIQAAHLKNIGKLVDSGKLIVAGPFLDDQKIRGIFIFNVESVEEAEKLTATDPAIQAGVLKMELHPWFGTAALIETVKIHKTIQQKNIMK